MISDNLRNNFSGETVGQRIALYNNRAHTGVAFFLVLSVSIHYNTLMYICLYISAPHNSIYNIPDNIFIHYLENKTSAFLSRLKTQNLLFESI